MKQGANKASALGQPKARRSCLAMQLLADGGLRRYVHMRNEDGKF